MCCYTPNNSSEHGADSAASPTKRRHLDTSPPSIHSALAAPETTSPQAIETMQTWDQVRKSEEQPRESSISGVTTQPPMSLSIPDHGRQGSFHHLRKLPSRNNANGLSEETNIYTETRMLQDQTGRLRWLPCMPTTWRQVSLMCLSSLHWRCLHLVHSAADPHCRREHFRIRHGLAFHR